MKDQAQKIVAKWAKKAGFTNSQHGYIMIEGAVEEAINAALDAAAGETTNTHVIAAIKRLKIGD